jgi:putative ABC transport system permease protein
MLAVAEIALSVVLLVGAGLLLHSFVRLERVDAGFHATGRNTLALELWVTQSRAVDSAARLTIFERLLERVRVLRGVKAAALSRTVPPDGGSVGQSPFMIEGQAWNPGAHPAFPYLQISDDYFGSLAIPLRKGRYFTRDDKVDSKKVTIIGESFARRYFPNEDPIGKRIKLGGPGYPKFQYMEIVGVVGDVKYFGLAHESVPTVYVPLTQDVPLYTFLIVRSEGSAVGVEQQVHHAIQSLDGDVVVKHMSTIEELLTDSVAEPRFRTTLLGIFSGVALILAAIGVYGVLAYSVVQRTHEIGVRVALGGQRRDILRLVMGQGLQVTLVGLAIGITISIGLTFVLRGLLFQVKPADPVTFISVAGLLGLTALVACYAPARRATRVDATVALRYE